MRGVNFAHSEVLQVYRGLLVAAVALTACGPEPESCEEAGRVDPKLQLGTGFEDFAHIEDGDALGIDFGEQGGWHVWMAFRTSGMVVGHGGGFGPPDPEGPTITCRLLNGEGEEVAAGEHSRFPIDGDAQQGEVLGVQMRVSAEVNVAIDGGGDNPATGSLTLEADAVDSCGAEASSIRSVSLDLSN